MSSSTEGNAGQDSSKSKELSISLGQKAELSLEGLSEDDVRELRKEHAKGMLRINEKANELGVEGLALRDSLRTMTDETEKASRDGIAVTMTRTTNDSLGRTEVIMGNTDAAQKGKLSRSQAGGKDYTLFYIGAAALIIIVVAILFSGG